MESIYDFEVEDINGNKIKLERYKGKTLLIVNTASKCGFTPQYAQLEEVYNERKSKNFEVLGFPCNQFGGQEPGSNDEIASFCALNYKTSFPLFAKIDVNGAKAHPLYRYLTDVLPGIMGLKPIKWNFTKFLISPTGHPVKRFAPNDTPRAIAPEIDALL